MMPNMSQSHSRREKWCYLPQKNLKLKHPKKSIWPKYIGPFHVAEPCGKLAYKLDLPGKWQIHNVISITQLENTKGKPILVPEDIEFDVDQEYEVEHILDHMIDDQNVVHYWVKWVGFNKEEDITWEP